MHIILFDGICNLCNGAVAFIIKRDKKALFRFAAMQSEAGQTLIHQYCGNDGSVIPSEENTTFYYIRGKECFRQSTAVLEILNDLGGGWRAFYPLRYIPVRARDAVYLFVSRNRYRWFGKRKTCGVPMASVRNRFIISEISEERTDDQ